jgi:hypothetical protein
MKFILFIFTDTYFMCCIVMNTSVELLHVASEFNLAGPPPPPPETISISEQPSANPDTFCEVGKYIRVRIQINIHRSNLSCLYLLIHIFFYTYEQSSCLSRICKRFGVPQIQPNISSSGPFSGKPPKKKEERMYSWSK